MARRILHLVFVLPLLMTYAALGGAANAGVLVLCLGDEGHVAIEPAHTDCADPVDAEPAAGGISADSGCHDIVLAAQETIPTRDGATVVPPLPVSLPASWGATSGDSPDRHAHALPPSRAASPMLLSLRTVVLLV